RRRAGDRRDQVDRRADRHRGRGLMIRKVAAALALVTLLAARRPAQAKTTLHVFAAASLIDAFDAIAKGFEKANSGVEVRVQYAGSQTPAAQIEQGAEADVFASADDRWMHSVSEKGFVDGEPKVFARNGLVF